MALSQDAAAIAGRPASLDAAVAAAGALLSGKSCVVVAGLGTDIAGAQAAMGIARHLGGAFDHMHGDALLADLDVMRVAGWIVTTPLQARARADLLLLVGEGVGAFAAALRLEAAPALFPDRPRRVIRLCPGRDPAPAGAETIGGATDSLPALLATLRALTAGRPVSAAAPRARPLAAVAEALRAARYGVAVWSAAHMDTLAIEMLSGLVDDLNLTTRFAGLPVPPPDNAAGVAQACAWQTGFPVRAGFFRGGAEHDPWRLDATRLVDSGEADAALWIAATSAQAPTWARTVPLVALVAPGTKFAAPPEVAITVGSPGVHHDGVLFAPELGGLAVRPGSAASDLPSVAAILARIAAAC